MKPAVKRFGVERDNVVLYPLSSSHPALELEAEDELKVLGEVVWRGG